MFKTEFASFDIELQLVVLDLFSVEFQAKLFYNLQPLEKRKKWVQKQLLKKKVDLVDIDDFDGLIVAFEWEDGLGRA